jgi:pyruvate ferredoxin oxidoreductase gamma subunit
LEKSNTIEIRWHGRGGQGAVTSCELLALAAISEGKYGQAFPSFGPERRGAPVMAFNRVSDQPIRVRCGIDQPDVVVVLDPGLLKIMNVPAGLKPEGTLVVNTRKSLNEIKKEFGWEWRLAALDGTKLAREILGVPITNTIMLGALLKAVPIVDVDSLTEPIEHRFGRIAEKNRAACQRAYEETVVE